MIATYSISFRGGLASGASALAIEQSLGTKSASREIADEHGARVVEIDEGSGMVRIAFPAVNLGSIPTLLVAVVGEALETQDFDRLRLISLEFPEAWFAPYQGPRFGIKGIRGLLGIADRPLLIAILKPSVGLAPDEAASLAASLARGGADIIKDDELASAVSGHDPVERARAVSEALAWVEAETLRPCVYTANITGPVDGLTEMAESLSDLGNVWPMVAEHAIGLDALRVLAGGSGGIGGDGGASRPILCHRAYSGAVSRSADFGTDAAVLAGLARLCGGDLIHCGGIGGKLFDTHEGALASMASCRRPLAHLKPSLPIIGGGYWAGSVGAVMRAIGDNGFGFVLGSGVTDHPDGAEAGMRSVAIALEAELGGEGIESVLDRPEIARAIDHYGAVWQ
ncbi:MAG: hypothetical protein DCC49_06115 [Acidobacteria bacterium]|nr:MAG: hypothetical protein DCC49_06115 [Acidobacteriota bacterium]